MKIRAAKLGVDLLTYLSLKIIICPTIQSEPLKMKKKKVIFSEYTWGKELVVLTTAVVRAIQKTERFLGVPW